MPNSAVVEALVTAINYDRFDEIQDLHAPGVVFHSFRSPMLRDSVAVRDFHHELLERYADCTYTEVEAVEDGGVVAVRATIEAKGYDWRAFQQRVLDISRVEDDLIVDRRLYGMMRDIELDKPALAAMDAANEFRGGSARSTRRLVRGLYEKLIAGERDEAAESLDEKITLVDSVYGIVSGVDAVLDLLDATPRPAFGYPRLTAVVAGEKDAAVEIAIDPARPRIADWVRIVEGKVQVIERHWMLREIGINPFVEYARDRHRRQVILPT
ncbi:MAG: nuclear transport factor 2 family protein [Chloroflexi bacterium]|nr:nuclear transport factor 2 family protein [Chloroflexota bacterium]